MRKRKPLTRFLSSPDFGLAWHLRVVAMLPEDHRPFWTQKLRQKAHALAKQERKLTTLPADHATQRHLWTLRKALTLAYVELLEHRRTMDAKSATRVLRAIA
jgi:hypothetical protein